MSARQNTNTEALACACSRDKDLEAVNDSDVSYCKKVLLKNEYCKKHQYSDTTSKYVDSTDGDKPENAVTKSKCAVLTPLILRKIQTKTITNMQRELAIEELYLCGVNADKKEKIIRMKMMLVKDEYPNPKNDVEKKFFFPMLLTADDWSKDRLDETLIKISDIRSKRL